MHVALWIHLHTGDLYYIGEKLFCGMQSIKNELRNTEGQNQGLALNVVLVEHDTVPSLEFEEPIAPGFAGNSSSESSNENCYKGGYRLYPPNPTLNYDRVSIILLTKTLSTKALQYVFTNSLRFSQ